MNARNMWGRDAEIEHIRETLADVAGGNGAIILYDGEAGIGKTRLIAEISSIAKAQDFDVFSGRCFDEVGVPVFWPWIEILRGIGRLSGWDHIQQVFHDDRDFLLSILPELKNKEDERSQANSHPIQSSTSSTFVKAYNFYRIIESASSVSPIVITLDDIQWADEQSIAVLRTVARSIEQEKVLVLLAYRTENAVIDESLRETTGELYRLPIFQRHTLNGLGCEDVKACVSNLTGRLIDDEASKLLQQATGGNALLTVSVAHAFSESMDRSEITVETIERLQVPRNVSAIVHNRMSSFSPECRYTLELGALIGQEFPVQYLIGIEEGWESIRVNSYVNEAVSGRIIEPAPGREGWCRFSHDLVRRAIIGEIAPGQKMHHHAAIARQIEGSIERSESAAVLLRHYIAAGKLLPQEKVAGYALRAGLQALKSGALSQCTDYFRKGLEMADEGADPETASMLNLHLGYLEMRREKGFEQALRYLDRACLLFEKTGNQTGLLQTVMMPAFYHNAQHGRLMPLFIRCLELAEKGTDAELYARSLVHISQLYEKDRMAEERLSELLDTARQRGLFELVIRIYNGLYVFHHMQGRFDKCVDDCEHTLSVLAKQNRADPEMYVRAMYGYVDSLRRTERVQHAHDELEKLSHFADLKTRPDLVISVGRCALFDPLETFDVRGQWKKINELISLCESVGFNLRRYFGPKLTLAFHNGLKEEFSEALESIRDDVAQGTPNTYGAQALIKYILLSDDCSQAALLRMLCTRLLETQGSMSKGRYAHIWNAGLATCELCEENYDKAAKLYEALRPEFLDHGHLDLGLIAWKLSRLDDAIGHLDAALGDRSMYSVWARLKLGEVLLQRGGAGELERALVHIDEARELAVENHIVPIAKQTEALLLRLEETLAAKPVRLPAGLTSREAEVLAQIAAGKSDKEIGAELFISPSTVSNHVQHIFTKTGAGNRTEAALFAVRNGIAAAQSDP